MAKIDTSTSYGVYRIISPNGSCYIGMTTKSFDERWNGHRASFRKGQMTCIGLQKAFEKYTPDGMEFEVLEDLSGYGEGEILYRERLWWLRHKAWGVNLYNGEPTGRGAVRHTEETREKIKNSLQLRASVAYEIRTCSFCGKDFRVLKKSTKKSCSRSCGAKVSNLTRGAKLERPITQSDRQLILSMYESEFSLRAISREIGIGHKRISNLLKSSGVEIKRRSGVKATVWKKTDGGYANGKQAALKTVAGKTVAGSSPVSSAAE